ncbi:putative glycine--tRNA ligase [Tolypocladium ophioglossoides CBS 100239]|uniref:glycine--tRNA ligase n=1 Tax=Tolypocladium ophioglossoides (strain CBS 100239) TaxID=1163406 RepID=A0A0L0MY34_TOLOC|nr:putative glycine--tRNA ligase [Tolypocladium ophioglossoides CBS 100239]
MAPMTTFKGDQFDRSLFESVIKRRFFFTESFEIYRLARNFHGDNRGLYDYGPPGCALQANIVDVWRKHFVLEENMLELDCTVITPELVLKTSGHVDKFADWMCKDPVKGEYLRADHLVENVLQSRLARGVDGPLKNSSKLDEATIDKYNDILAKIDNYDGPELGDLIKKFDIRNPDGNGEVLPPIPFNLMFKCTVGPSAAAPVYLRPETAQGQFLNFRKLLEFNQGAMPFASASIGKSYRNEISPRSGLLRVREFLMAEIEHYVDPEKKEHQRFQEVVGLELPLLDKETQLAGKTTPRSTSIEEAVKSKTIDNETLGYFLGRIMLFLLKIGVDPSKLRFRQHLDNEMAHYACDCWDAELLTSYGWIECVGCADRSAYDLTVHSNFTGTPLVVKETLRTGPIKSERWQASLDKKLVGPKFKQDAKAVQASVEALKQPLLESLAAELNAKGVVTVDTATPLADGTSSVELSRELLTIQKVTQLQTVREYTPNVIEPSFGIGRILYCLLEQTYWHRPQDAARAQRPKVLSLPLVVAPTKVLIVPISAQSQFVPIIRRLSSRLRALGITNNVDSSGASIGKRYARNDELGTPLGITVDFDTVANGSITLRDRDTTSQVRGSEDEVLDAVNNLVGGVESWQQITQHLAPFSTQGQDND